MSRTTLDLSLLDGTCYLGETIGVAVRERCGRFLASHQPIPQPHLDGRVVTSVALPELEGSVADLTSPDAALFGVTAELAIGNDYNLSAAWAQALREGGMRGGLYYLPRFTPGQEYALAVFGPGGDRSWGILDQVKHGIPQPSKLAMRVRFSSPAPRKTAGQTHY